MKHFPKQHRHWQRFTFLALMVCQASLTAEEEDAVPQALWITEWNEVALRSVQLNSPPPCLAARNFAIVFGSCHEVINTIENKPATYLYTNIPAPAGVHTEIAVTAAAWTSTVHLFPGQKANFTQLKDAQLEQFRRQHPDADFTASWQFGEAIAKAFLMERADDGSTSQITYVPKNEIGQWKRTPKRYRPAETPHWSGVRPFFLKASNQFRPDGPPPLQSEEYAANWEEIRLKGAKQNHTRSEDETLQAIFWSGFSYTSTPPGQWNQIVCRIAQQRQMSLTETTRLIAWINYALADAGIAAWDTKYHYHSWRPVHAVPLADKDGNPLTTAASAWEPLLETPPHPDYVSGHSVFSGAAAQLLAHYFSTDNITFTTISDSLPGVERTFSSFSECADEISNSRIYGGIHFRFACKDGLVLGKDTADWIFQHLHSTTLRTTQLQQTPRTVQLQQTPTTNPVR